jgi:hypothetical protein
MSDYLQFLERRTHIRGEHGFTPSNLPSHLFPFQADLVAWALSQARAAIFADCGLGKTLMQLVWADQVAQHTGGRVLILTPLAVSAQTIAEAEKFGIEAVRSRDGKASRVTVTNYERLHYFNPTDFVGVVCDESSILKNFDGVRKTQITAFLRKLRYRLLCTATAAPNDYIELGTSSEALGNMGAMDMMNRYFKNDQNNSSTGRHYGKAMQWRFKGHAEDPFWKWVCSWARAVRKPSDLGYENDGFILPKLTERYHMVETVTPPDGMLFALPAVNFHEQREERRRTIKERCDRVAELVDHSDPALVWCHLNDEADLLEDLIPGAVQVSGADSDDAKEEKLIAFASGQARVLVTKPQIGAWGLNFQHCNHVTFFPSHSYEQYYQGVRRCWRFGQKRPVAIDVVTTEGQKPIMDNLRRKAEDADKMFTRLVEHMTDQLALDRRNEYTQTVEAPSWL